MDSLGLLPHEICFKSHLIVNVCAVLYLRVYLCHMEPFGKKSHGSQVSSLLDNCRQQMPVCARMISSWVTNILSITKDHLSPGIPYGTAVLVALADVPSLVSFLQPGDSARVSTPARHYIFIYITTTDKCQDSVQGAVLVLSE